MKSIMQVLFSSIRAKVVALYTKVRMFTNPSYLKALFTGKLRQFFISLFDIKPKNKEDYYSVSKWLIGKKLAFSMIIIIGALSLWYIVSLAPATGKAKGMVPAGGKEVTYKYSSMSLKKYTGQARIVAEKKHIAYIGDITDGLATGNGTLYNKDGQTVYVGDFANNMYNGTGKLYFATGDLKYSGEFKSNLFNGKGKLYGENGTAIYDGEFENDLKNGTGTLYSGAGKPLFAGRFHRDDIVYSDFIGRTTGSLGEVFLGTSKIYNYGESSCVSYDGLSVIVENKANGESLVPQQSVKNIFVLRDSFKNGDKALLNKADLDSYFGTITYAGDTYVKFAEAVAISEIIKGNPQMFSQPLEITFDKPFDEVYNLVSYNTELQIYIVSYQKDGLLYTFYFENPNDTYKFYSIG